ncbi:hypothetical protein N1851_003414 [Merluccius polli]|uniref:Uncharacterized protein n=1 Tax=Merluccius polli TaxID=89951 RepID=A0AA47N8Q8_MERPO|nr:hypothetical protein N1851_003414 [Merluccius polli]
MEVQRRSCSGDLLSDPQTLKLSAPHLQPHIPPNAPQLHLQAPASLVSPNTQDPEYKRQLSTLAEEDSASSVLTGANSVSNQKLDTSRTQERKRGAPFGVEAVRRSAGPESLISLLPFKPLRTPQLLGPNTLKCLKLRGGSSQKSESLPPSHPATLKQSPANPELLSISSFGESLDRPRSHLTKMTIQLGTPNANSKPVQSKPNSASNTKPPARSVQTTSLQIGQPFETVPNQKQRIEVVQMQDVLVDHMGDYTVSMDLGEKRTAASVLSCPKEVSSDFPSTAMRKILEANSGKYNVVMDTLSNCPQTQSPEIAPAAQKSLKDQKLKDVAAMTVPGTLKTASDVGSQAQMHKEESDVHLASTCTRTSNVPGLTPKHFEEETINMFIDTKPHDERLDTWDEHGNP